MRFAAAKLLPMVVCLMTGVTGAGETVGAKDELARSFHNPPDAARPGVYWYFMDGNLSREAMTDDLESMKEVGIGHLVFLEVDVGVPRGPVAFLSDEWRALFLHAVREAERLGIEITLGSGPGWAGSGGPWVGPEQSMQHLVASAVEVEGPSEFDGRLPRPAPRKPYFGLAPLSDAMRKQREAFYEDVAVLAFPTPGEQMRIADIDEKALYYRAPYSSRPGVKPYLPAPADHAVVPPSAKIDRAKVVNLIDQLRDGGRLSWTVPRGHWTIMRFGRRTTGATTRPAPRSVLGFECDKFDAGAFDVHFENYIGKLLRTVGSRKTNRGWTMLHIDSWEMGAQNWTRGFRSEFRRRRGYDLLPFLPTYTGRVVGSLELSERFLWDVRVTAQDLVLENYAGRFKRLGRQHGFGLSIEPYDMNPCSDLDLGGLADVPMCEFWSQGFGFDTSYSCIEATSIGHVHGRPVVAAEAFTANGKEAWKMYPGAMKNQGDWAFCMGINRLVYHTFAHKPRGRRPGMAMGPYGVHWDRGQTWWPMASAYHRYITRCQYMLRQGNPVVDVCYLAPEGVPNVFRPPPSALQGSRNMPDRRSYNFDGCSPRMLINHATVEDGNVVFPGGSAYRLLVLPACDTMTPALLDKIRELVQAGATVVGAPPRKSPSLTDYPQCDERVRSMAADLWRGSPAPAEIMKCETGRGRVVWGGDLHVDPPGKATARKLDPIRTSPRNLQPSRDICPHLYPHYAATARLLGEMGVLPDFETDAPIRYTHRRTETFDIYFVSSREAKVVEAWCTFRVAGKQPELWDPLSGEIRHLARFKTLEGRVTVPIRFEPHQSFFVLFAKEISRKNQGSEVDKNFLEFETVRLIKGPWDVVFDVKAGGPKQAVFPTLEDWSRRSEPGIKFYSGIATYRNRFDLPDVLSRRDRPIRLDLGVVHNLARVRLNGHDLGVVWCAPWSVDITRHVRAKDNQLEIEVANLWPNRLIGDLGLPAKQRVAWTTYNPYHADSPLLPSGLLGPVTLMAPVRKKDQALSRNGCHTCQNAG